MLKVKVKGSYMQNFMFAKNYIFSANLTVELVLNLEMSQYKNTEKEDRDIYH